MRKLKPVKMYRGADKSLALPNSRCILFDSENISFDASLDIYIYIYIYKCGPGSSVGKATAYGLDGPGIESRWGEIFRTSPDRP